MNKYHDERGQFCSGRGEVPCPNPPCSSVAGNTTGIGAAARDASLGVMHAANGGRVSDAPGGRTGPSGFVELPHNGTGYYLYGDQQGHWATPATTRSMQEVAKEWNDLHPDKSIGIGNMSLERGGAYPPHKAHKLGLDIDIRPIRKDGKRGSVTWTSPQYDREATQDLINLLNKNPRVRKIYFNDPKIRGASPLQGHDNHLHIEFR